MRKAALLISAFALAASAQESGLSSDVQVRSLPAYTMTDGVYLANPGILSYRDTLSLSEAKASIGKSDIDNPAFPQNGTGRQNATIGASSYMHLDSRQTVSGNASFSVGKIRDMKWSDCLDYDLIAPYALGDDTGGDLSCRRYDFGGAYSCRVNDRVSLGAKVDYKAQIGWRDIDPRIRTVVSDLTATFGIGYRLQSHVLALSAGMRSYTQNCDLEFYNPLNDINTLPLTGMGSYNKRFAGNTNKSSGHSGFGYRIGVDLVTADRRGIMCGIAFKGMKIDLMLRNFNNITLAYTDTYTTTGYLGCALGNSERLSALVLADATYSHRLGTENLFGTAAGASYNVIGHRSPYLREILEARLRIPVTMTAGTGKIWAMPAVSYTGYTEKLTSLSREMEIKSISSALTAGWSVASGKWLCDISVGCSLRNNLSGKCTMPGYDDKSALQHSVMQTYDILKAKSLGYCAEVVASRLVGKILCGLALGFEAANVTGFGNYNLLHTSLEIKF